jgi:hypothetical protein
MVGYQVKMIETGRYKTISEVEKIDGVDIFYMSDGTSCVYSQFSLDETIDGLLQRIKYEKNLNVDTQNYVSNLKENINLFAKTFAFSLNRDLKRMRDEEKSKTRTFKVFGWTITFSKSK